MIGKDKKMIQVVITNTTYEYLKKYADLFGTSISSYCNQAIVSRIINSDKYLGLNKGVK